MSWLYLFPWEPAGVILLAAGLLLAAIRVLAGVHYLSDVVAGALIGILAAAIGYQIL
jgi:membrane-associated phospholipid phosphatase